MGLFDALTGDASRRAGRLNQMVIGNAVNAGTTDLNTNANSALAYLGLPMSGGNAMQALGSGYGQARTDLTGQYGQTQGYLTSAGQQTQGYLQGGAGQARADLGAGYGGAAAALGDAYGQTQGSLGALQTLYQPLTEQGRAATSLRDDALGVNGAEGSTRALDAFKSSLGYGAGLDTGLDSVLRSAAARGNLAGGNTSQDLFNYGADYQNKQAGNFLDRLTQAGSSYATGLAGQGAALTGQANAAQTYGSNLAGVLQGQGTALGALANGLGVNQASAAQTLGSGQASASQNQGSALTALGTGLGRDSASVYGSGATLQNQLGSNLANLQLGGANAQVSNNNNVAQAQNQASGNFINLLGNALGGLTSFATGGGTLSGLANVFR